MIALCSFSGTIFCFTTHSAWLAWLAENKSSVRRGSRLLLGHWSTQAVLEVTRCLCVCSIHTSGSPAASLPPYPHSAQVWQFSHLQCHLRFQLPTNQHNYPFRRSLATPGWHNRTLVAFCSGTTGFLFCPQPKCEYCKISLLPTVGLGQVINLSVPQPFVFRWKFTPTKYLLST